MEHNLAFMIKGETETKFCPIGKVWIDVPSKSKIIDGDLMEHGTFLDPCPGCLRLWGKLNSDFLSISVLTRKMQIEDCSVIVNLSDNLR